MNPVKKKTLKLSYTICNVMLHNRGEVKKIFTELAEGLESALQI